MTTLTDREKALVEATKNYILFPSNVAVRDKLTLALRAYDPPKEKVYVLPTWEQIAVENGRLPTCNYFWMGNGQGKSIMKDDYNAIREATAKEQE